MRAIGIIGISGDGFWIGWADSAMHDRSHGLHVLHDGIHFSFGPTLVSHNRNRKLRSDESRSDNSCAAKSFIRCLFDAKTIRTKRGVNDEEQSGGTDGFPTAASASASDDGFDNNNNNYSARDFANTEGMSVCLSLCRLMTKH